MRIVMPTSNDTADSVQRARERAESSVESFSGYETLEDALDAYAQRQIEYGNQVQMESDAKTAAWTGDDQENIAAQQEAEIRHELAQAIQGLLEEYGHTLHRGAGVDADARSND